MYHTQIVFMLSLVLVIVYWVLVCVSKIEEEVGLSAHLLHYDYFRPVVYENNPIEELTDEYVEERLLQDEEEDRVKNVVPVTYRLIPGIHHGSRVYVDI